jgi:protein-tyrosine-phosphatase
VNTPKNILFVCLENAGRSQIAEAFFKKYDKNKFNVISAGTTPSSHLNPIVILVMAEIGIDLKNQQPQLLSNSMIENSTKTINMGCMDKESCPSLFVNDTDNWKIDDPKGKSIDDVRKIRDQIKTDVLNLIDSLESDNS